MSALLHAKVKSNRLTIAARRAIPSDSTSHLACNVMCVSERGGGGIEKMDWARVLNGCGVSGLRDST